MKMIVQKGVRKGHKQWLNIGKIGGSVRRQVKNNN
jgi:hypothetical protein